MGRIAAVGLAVVALPGSTATTAPTPPRVALVAAADARPVEWSLPVPPAAVTPGDLRAPHHDYPASDLMVPTGTPVLAVHAGEAVSHEGPRCGKGVTLTAARRRFVYCHLSRVAVARGPVRAADVLGLSGDTGNARGVPHLHFHVVDGGRYVCPQALFPAWAQGRPAGPVAWGVVEGCFFGRGSQSAG